MDPEEAVPSAARLVRDFVNSAEPQVSGELLTTPERLRDWLAERGLVPVDAWLGPADLTAAVAIREGLRAVLLGHAGYDPVPADLEHLNRALAAVPLRPVFTADGYHLAACGGTPFDHASAQLVDAVRQCAETDAWRRLKVCARDTCRWAYFDESRNQVRRWCSMAGCGNQAKMRRAYAARKARVTGVRSDDV